MTIPETKVKTLRWYILRTLLRKEISRHLANSGGLILAGLLIVVALLSSIFGKTTNGMESGNLTASVHNCFIEYWQDDPWIKHLEAHVPDDLHGALRFRHVNRAITEKETLVYPPGTGAIRTSPQRKPGRTAALLGLALAAQRRGKRPSAVRELVLERIVRLFPRTSRPVIGRER